MENISYKINSLSKELLILKQIKKESFDSVFEARRNHVFNSFVDTCDQILHLIGGYKWDFYNKRFMLHRYKEFKTNDVYDICNIYSNTFHGRPIGFVCTKECLFLATKYHHRDMWIFKIKKSFKEENRSFEDFCSNLKTDINFLEESFQSYMQSKRQDAYLQIYENRKLKIKKHYVFQEVELEES